MQRLSTVDELRSIRSRARLNGNLFCVPIGVCCRIVGLYQDVRHLIGCILLTYSDLKRLRRLVGGGKMM